MGNSLSPLPEIHPCTCKTSENARKSKCSKEATSINENMDYKQPPTSSRTIGTQVKGRVRSISVGEFPSNETPSSKRTNASTSGSIDLKSQFLRGAPPQLMKNKGRDSKDKKRNSLEQNDLLLRLANMSLKCDNENSINDNTKGEIHVKEDLELPENVLYYGWFISPEVSSIINTVVMQLFTECIQQVNQFERFILTCCKDADVKDANEYYKKPGKKLKSDEALKYHITAKFLGRAPDISYQTSVHSFLEKNFHIRLVGLVFTPRTLGVRVKLSPAQQLIFDEKDEKRDDSLCDKIGKKKITKQMDSMIKQIQEELEGYSRNDKMHKILNQNCKMKSDKNGISYKKLAATNSGTLHPAHLTKSRAHITIGCARNVAAKQTGDDLVDINDLEQRPPNNNSNFVQDFKVTHGTLRQFGRHANAFVLYPDYEMTVPAEFNYFI